MKKMHETDVQTSTLTLPRNKSNKNVHVQFNDVPTVVNLSPSPSEPSQINEFEERANESYKLDKRSKNKTRRPKSDDKIHVNDTRYVNASPEIEEIKEIEIDNVQIREKSNQNGNECLDLENNVQNEPPPPFDLSTLPPRSSLLEGLPLDLPIELLTAENNNSTDPSDGTPEECSISLVGNFVQKDKAERVYIKDDEEPEKILVSTAYTNLPSPLSVPNPSEVPEPATPLYLNTSPSMQYMYQNSRPLSAHIQQDVNYIPQRPLSAVYMAPTYVMTPVISSQPVIVTENAYIPFNPMNVPMMSPVPNSVSVPNLSQMTEKKRPPVPAKPKRMSAYFPSENPNSVPENSWKSNDNLTTNMHATEKNFARNVEKVPHKEVGLLL